MRILIAEDDFSSSMFMKKWLSAYGSCELAMNGIEVLELYTNSIKTNNPYSLICMDIMMPKVDGMKALELIREMEQTALKSNQDPTIVIMTTALQDEGTIREAYQLGCNGYASKPINLDEFDHVLKELEVI